MLRAALATVLAALALAAPAAADWSGDGAADVLAVHPDGAAAALPRDRRRRLPAGGGQGIGTGWGQFTALLTGDWSGDGKPDILARASDGRLLMYRGNGSGGFATGAGRADRLAAGGSSPRCCCRATGTATASPTSSPATATGGC